jgi:Na+/phosphate symporter
MLVGFVSAGLMTSVQSIGVIFGANIGTTITAQIIAFKVTKFSLLLVAVGFVMDFAGKRETVKQYGSLIMGLGLIFFGLAIMSSGMKPLRSYEPFILLMQDVSSPAIGIAVALVFTAAVQSSSATTGVVIALAIQGLISLEGGIGQYRHLRNRRPGSHRQGPRSGAGGGGARYLQHRRRFYHRLVYSLSCRVGAGDFARRGNVDRRGKARR